MPNSLITHIDPLTDTSSDEDGATLRTISIVTTQQLSQKLGIAPKQIEIEALRHNIVPTRYLRNQKSMNCSDQIRLLNAKISVVGLGGLGGLVVEALARIGVGHLQLIDGDRFEDHNLNRQLFSTQQSIGQSKADAAALRVKEINTAIDVQVTNRFLNDQNGVELIQASHVVIDCLDNITSRFDLESAAKISRIPLVSAAVAGLTGHVTTVFPQDKGLTQIYGARPGARHAKGAEATLGCLPQSVFVIAALESAEAVKILLGNTKDVLRNKLCVVDLTNNIFEVLVLSEEA